ncbi:MULTISPECIES: restriction endonuclease subunit S [unclassified Fibrobacter]|uniref:restriction endonuclease subunit S n=1 Tax=unclassified Fibrobacter TaxID=2634177 RepID=UPI000933A74E|nr:MULTISPECIES: restriction endonuclease subunit S [unclassified Fibrobacter]
MKAIDYCQKVFDGTHDSPKPVENGRLLITSKHIANRCLETSSAYLISEEDFENVNKRSQVHQWDVLFSMIGTVGNVYIETSNYIDYAIKNMGVFSCRNKEKAYWLYYYLQSPLVLSKIDALMAGAVQKFVPLGFLRDLDIPEYTEKSKHIVSVLSALDDKIALNKKMNQKLEAMAKRLYDYWFVQFDFPDGNGRPYKTSGGPMVYNPILKREIPTGWEVKNLGEIVDVLKDGTHNPPQRVEQGIPLLTGTMFGNNFLDYSKATYISEQNYQSIHARYQPKENDVIITKIGTLGNVNLLRDCDIPIAIHCNSALLRFQKNFGSFFPFMFCKSDLFQLRLKSVKGQSIQEFASLDKISSVLCEVPSQNVLKQFNDIIEPLLKLLIDLSKEISRLTSLRDKLLPLLMNGQVVVE